MKGPGYSTWEEAFTAPEILTNQSSPLTIETHVIDEAYTDVTFNEQGFLAVSRTAMTLKGAHTTASTDNKVEVLTNVAGGFRVWSFDNNGTEVPAGGWLRSSTAGGAANANTTVQAITNGKGFKNGYLEVRAGRLYTKVNVEQLVTPLELVAEYNLAGGFLYGSSFTSSNPAGASPTSAQTDLQLRWATNHNNDQSGYYNWYVLKGITESTYNPAGKNLFSDSFFSAGNPGHGYHLPSLHELTGVFSYQSNAAYATSTGGIQSANEACEFGGIKKTFTNDYYSTGNGVCYALRFKKATGNPNDGSPLSEFSKAIDDHMCCAYRYTRIAPLALKVDCIYLGEAGASLRPQDIGNDAWWNARVSEIVTRIFPAAGHIERAIPCSRDRRLHGKNIFGQFWSGTEFNSSHARAAYFYSGWANTYVQVSKHAGFSVRLFANE
ncbi:hypothetical protein JCM10003_3940 [Bacteroides pyogenes JCM 10003]|nr:hypothetical protein JCM10003_3940 [Bacteroides pyogenes JCM 10003]